MGGGARKMYVCVLGIFRGKTINKIQSTKVLFYFFSLLRVKNKGGGGGGK